MASSWATRIGLYSCYLAVFLDLVGAFMVAPFLPFVALKFQATPFQITMMQSLYSLAQIVGTVVLGKLSDSVGRRLVLLICLITSTFALAAFGLASSFFELLLFRAMSGFFAGTIGICEAFIVDLVEDNERASSLSKIGAVFGLGAIAGPGLGGGLANLGFSFTSVCFVAAGCTFLNFVIAAAGLPADKKLVAQKSAEAHDSASEAPSFIECLRQQPRLAVMYLHSALTMFGVGSFIGIFPLFVHATYGFGATQVGSLMSTAGVGAVVFQVVAVQRVVRVLGTKKCMMVGSALRAVGYALPTLVFSPYVPYVSQMMIVCFGGLIMPCQVSLTSDLAPESARGSVLGALNALGSTGQFVGPLLAGCVYKTNKMLPLLFASAASLIAAALASFLRIDAPVDGAGSPQRGNSEPLLVKRASSRGSSRSPTRLELIHTGTMEPPSLLMDAELCGGSTPFSSHDAA